MSPEAVPLCASLPPGTTEQRRPARAAAAAAGTRSAWRAAGSKPRSAIWRRGRTRASPPVSAGCGAPAFPAFRVDSLLLCPPPPSRNVGLGEPKCQAMQTKVNALRARESASRALPSYLPAREAFPKEVHDVRIVESLRQGVRSLLWSLLSHGSQQLGSGNRSAPTPALTSCSSFGSGTTRGWRLARHLLAEPSFRGPRSAPTRFRRPKFHLCRVTPGFGAPWEG